MRTHEQDKQDVKTAVQTILNALNGGNQADLAAVILTTLRREHRTIQQSFVSALMQVLVGYADAPNDLRNEQAVKFANAVKTVATEKFSTRLPNI